MIEGEILNDIKGYEPKFIGPLTLRQTACIGLATITSLPIGFLTGQVFINEIAITIGGIVGVPFMICGFWKPYGIPFEKFAKQFIKMQILAPKNRKYKTENYYESFMPKDNNSLTKKELKKHIKMQKKESKNLGSEFQMYK